MTDLDSIRLTQVQEWSSMKFCLETEKEKEKESINPRACLKASVGGALQ
jgi:hypothetical protein